MQTLCCWQGEGALLGRCSRELEANRKLEPTRRKSLRPPPFLQSPSCALCWQSKTRQAKNDAESRCEHHQADYRKVDPKLRAQTGILSFVSPFSPSLLLSKSPILFGLWGKKQTIKHASENLPVLIPINSILDLYFNFSRRWGRGVKLALSI